MKNIHAKRSRRLKCCSFVFLLLVSLYSLSRPLHQAGKKSSADDYVAGQASLVNDNPVNPSFIDNRGNVAWNTPNASAKNPGGKLSSTTNQKR